MAVYSERFGQFITFEDNPEDKWVVKNPRGDIVSICHSESEAKQCAADWNSTYQETAYSFEEWSNKKWKLNG